MGKRNEEKQYIKLKFCGANGIVTGSCTHLEFPHGLQMVVDCGLVQDSAMEFEKVHELNMAKFNFDAKDVSVVVLTHGHLDHVAKLPLLIKQGFDGYVIATQPTAEFASINIPDSAYLNGEEVKRWNEKAEKKKINKRLEPLYTEQEAKDCINYIRCYDFDKEIKIDEYVTVILKRAGHILGACSPLIIYKNGKKETRLLFTGDTSGKVKNIHPYVPVADDIGDVDYCQIESTYGDRKHEKNVPLDIIEQSIYETCVVHKKTLCIPSFSIQRSSEILWLIREAYNRHPEFVEIPIFLDSPMSCDAQGVMNRNREYWNDESLKRDEELGNLFEWEQVKYIYSPNASKALANGDRKVIISSSGMCNGGRIKHHLASFLPSKNCKILFCGYQGEKTLGKNILETKHQSITIDGKSVRINAKRDFFEFSSHADYCQLIEYLKTSKRGSIKKIFIVHGSNKASYNLKSEIEQQLHINCEVPKNGDEIKIEIN